MALSLPFTYSMMKIHSIYEREGNDENNDVMNFKLFDRWLNVKLCTAHSTSTAKEHFKTKKSLFFSGASNKNVFFVCVF